MWWLWRRVHRSMSKARVELVDGRQGSLRTAGVSGDGGRRGEAVLFAHAGRGRTDRREGRGLVWVRVHWKEEEEGGAEIAMGRGQEGRRAVVIETSSTMSGHADKDIYVFVYEGVWRERDGGWNMVAGEMEAEGDKMLSKGDGRPGRRGHSVSRVGGREG